MEEVRRQIPLNTVTYRYIPLHAAPCRQVSRTREALRAEREELMKDTTRLTNEVNQMGEAVADDGDALDARSEIAEINQLRKKDVLAARAELEACQEALATEQANVRAAHKERDEKDEALTALKREHAGATRLNEELQVGNGM